MTKIVLIEDHHLVREGIKALLEKLDGISVAGEAPDGKEGLDLVRKIKPDLVIMDINLPKVNGINATKTIRNEFPEIKVVVLSMYSDEGIVRQAFAAGARGYLLKNSLGAELSMAIQSVMNNKVYFSPEIASVFLNEDPNLIGPTVKEDLTIREMEILQLIAEGNTNN